MKPLSPADPSTIGPNRTLARLGAGGMGQVYLARTADGRLAAVKAVRRELAEDHDFVLRFAREVRTAQRVRGPFTPAVLDADPEAPVPWMATEYVPGPTLKEAVRENGPFPEPSLVVLTLGLARALQAIHAAGLMHRDLKPGNVLLSPRGPQVIDFGIARAVEGTVLTRTGQSFGTPSYTSPEQILGKGTGPASDVFSLAGIVVYAATGSPAFGRGPAVEILPRVVSEDPDLSEVPESLRPLLTRCLAKDPAERPTSDEILHELSARPLPTAEHGWLPPDVDQEIGDRHRELDRLVAAPPSGPDPVPRGRRRTLISIGGAGAALLLLAGVGLAVTRPWETVPETADTTRTEEADTVGEEDPPAGPALPGTFFGTHFSGDGDSLYVNTSEAITLWDWRTGELVETVFSAGDGERPHSFDVSADGSALAGAYEDGVVLWNDAHEEVATYTSDAPDELDLFDSVSLSADGSLLAFRERDRDGNVTVRVWDPAEDTVVWEREVGALLPVLSPDGARLLLDHGSDLPRLEVVDLDTDDTLVRFPLTELDEDDFHPVYTYAFAPGSALLGVSGATERTTVLYDLSSGEVVHEFESSGPFYGLAFTPDGSRLLAGRASDGLESGGLLWDLDTGETVLDGNSAIYKDPAVHPEEETIVVADTGRESTTLFFLDPETLRDTHRIG
ncbi:WD40 repeat domain-containing serine/threonine protein kinase [Nocardiopsis alba]|uniref:WD40 repeat domain-containing serine/threonine protein kinase n=1 Tax=Nocardiopsis alba TaxID=53437 RepID=UPI0033AFE147